MNRGSDDDCQKNGMDVDDDGTVLEYVAPLMRALFTSLRREMWKHPTYRERDWSADEGYDQTVHDDWWSV